MLSMKKVIILFLCCLLVACSKPEENANTTTSIFRDTSGTSVQLSGLKGKWVIVNYWAPWCESCIDEMPELNKFYQDIKSKNDIVMYGVSYDRLSEVDLNAAIAKVDLKFPVLTDDPNSAWQLGPFDFIPVTFILNPEGQVVKKIIGPNTAKSLHRVITELQAKENA